MNGGPTELPANVQNFGRLALESAAKIHLVDEEVNTECEKVREAAKQAIRQSHRIFVLGFHFDDVNLRAIGLTETEASKVYCLNYNGNLGLRQRMAKLGVPARHIMSGTPERPLDIDQALDDGFLEQ